ncbi:MAG: hypothetical protein CMH26_07965 [Micavibrio sp.]|nr:hypothetical protein [Micavibrio sp.]
MKLKTQLSYAFFALGLCLALSACGVKPSQVKAPDTSKEDSFPRTYPDLKHDPAPTSSEILTQYH